MNTEIEQLKTMLKIQIKDIQKSLEQNPIYCYYRSIILITEETMGKEIGQDLVYNSKIDFKYNKKLKKITCYSVNTNKETKEIIKINFICIDGNIEEI